MAYSLTPYTPEPVARRTLGAVLTRQLAERPDEPAIVDPEVTLTYRELAARAGALGAALRRRGIERGTPVLLMLDNHAEFVTVWVALSLIGAVEVPVNTAYRGSILTHVVHDSGARVALVEEAYRPLFDGLDSGLEILVRHPGESMAAVLGARDADAAAPVDLHSWDPMGILYTSGTTGPSKGVSAPHGLAYTYSSAPWIRPGERIAVFLPLFHIGGQWAGVYAALLAGGAAVVFPRFSAGTFWGDVAAHGCTQVLMLGAMADFLWSRPAVPTDREHTLRHVTMVPVIARHAEFAERFGVAIGSAYGMTEFGSPILTPYGAAEAGLAGWLRDDVEARVVDADDVELPPGQAGEITLRARVPWAMMSGYHGLPEATTTAWRNLWFHTGDILRRDADGRFHFVDRLKDALRVRGENVSSFEVESEILGHPAVAACAVVGVPSEHTEDEIKAAVVLKDGHGLDPAELLAFLVERLPYFMVPRYVEVLDALPVTPTQKILKSELRDRGVTVGTWDRERAGLRVTRRGLEPTA